MEKNATKVLCERLNEIEINLRDISNPDEVHKNLCEMWEIIAKLQACFMYTLTVNGLSHEQARKVLKAGN